MLLYVEIWPDVPLDFHSPSYFQLLIIQKLEMVTICQIPYVSVLTLGPSHKVATKTAVQQFHFPSFREIRGSVFLDYKGDLQMFNFLLF